MNTKQATLIKDFNGKTGFITGGTSGIGLALAEALLARGMKIALSYRSPAGRETALERLAPFEKNLLTVQLDVSDPTQMRRAAEKIQRRFGKLHLLCNNAGACLFRNVEDASIKDWEWMLDVNLKSIIHSLDSFLPLLKTDPAGAHIINVASMAAFLPSPISGVYAASKYAVLGMSEALRYSLAGEGIAVSVVCPGLVNTNMFLSQDNKSSKYRNAGEAPEHDRPARLKEIYASGMQPMAAAEKILSGIERNQFYIFTHPDHRTELSDKFKEILQSFPDEEVDEGRWAVEEERRERIRARKAQADALD